MRFKGLDLNLLLALDVLLELRNVSRTAERLNLSQPALSAALARLREYFGDEILVIHGKRMYPTPFAERLVPHMKLCLEAADMLVATSVTFDPAKAVRTFRIVSSDYVLAAVLVRVARLLANTAPGIRLEFVLPDESASERLLRGEMDLMISPEEFLPSTHPRELLYDEAHVVVGWRDNQIFARPLTEEDFFAAGHLAVAMGSQRLPTFSDRHLARLKHNRRIEVVASSFTMIPWLLVGTERLALMHHRLAIAMAQHFPIAFAPLPFEFPVMHQMVQYHRARAADEGLRWLIDEIRAAAALDHQ